MKKSIGVLFDYNGVIANDEPLHEAAFAKVLSAYDITLDSEVYRQFCLGRTDREAFEKLQSQFPQELSSQLLERLVEQKQLEYRKLLPHQDILYPGAIIVIEDLKDYAKLGIVTGAMRAEVVAVLDNNGISSAFDVIITAEDIDKGKPDPQGYLKGMQALGLPPTKVIAVEDSRSGVQAARSAGIKCIALLHTLTHEDLVTADVIVESISDINRLLIVKILNALD